MNPLVWTIVIAVVATGVLVTQALMMRASHRRTLARQHAKHQQHQQTLNSQFEQTRKQIAQLQSELATARREVRQLTRKSAAAPAQRDQAAIKQSLERDLDAGSAARRELPKDGFAETQPSLSVTQYGSLLMQ
jgi:Skp family chaperone for outer membrane proteins